MSVTLHVDMRPNILTENKHSEHVPLPLAKPRPSGRKNQNSAQEIRWKAVNTCCLRLTASNMYANHKQLHVIKHSSLL